MSTEHTLSEALETAQARIAELTEALRKIDRTLRVPAAEYVPAISDVFTIIDAALPPPVAVWPRVFVDDVGEYVIFLNQGTVGEWFAPDGRTTERYTPMNGIVYSQSFGETDRELHGESRLAALAKCGLDENGKAIKKDGV